MASAYQIHLEMEAAQTPADLAAVLALRDPDIIAIGDRGYTEDVDALRKHAMLHAERVTGRRFTTVLVEALAPLKQ